MPPNEARAAVEAQFLTRCKGRSGSRLDARAVQRYNRAVGGEFPPKLREGGHMLLVTRRGLRGFAIAVGALLVALACGTTQGNTNTTAQNAPGVTDTSILIGTTQPLSGAASAYAT